MGNEIVATYIGNGSYVVGIPARDLTTEDYRALAPELQMTVSDCGLYQMAAKPLVEE